MTFIASVRAKNGVAIIADSLVTTMHRNIEYSDFQRMLSEKQKESNSKEISLSPDDLSKIFKNVPSHTSDYENKLINYDKYTAITTSGSAYINDKSIEDILLTKIKQNEINKKSYSKKSLKNKVSDLENYLIGEIRKHINKHGVIYTTTLIVTHFNRRSNKTSIYRISILGSSKQDLSNKTHLYIQSNQSQDYETVVCSGQTRISEGILFGDYFSNWDTVPIILDKVADDFCIDKTKITSEYVKKIRDEVNSRPRVIDGMKIFKLRRLSLQQAVDLAWLLMNIEIDFQKYTENIPTVGGLIKLAIIDKSGLRYVCGNNINKPKSL